jgi:homoserine O-succinyltransferase/O-acetyltransferase
MSAAEAPRAPHHRGVTRTDAAATSAHASPLRIGIINIMPRAETYERYLLAPLGEAGVRVEPIWIRLRSHVYSSSDVGHITRRYETYEDSFGAHGLDGLILTGAPVEELSFDDITYWPELSEILCHARAYVPTTLGLCWGGLALAQMLGISKRRYPRKLFGAFQHRRLVPDGALLGGGADLFWCAQSRHSGLDDAELEQAARNGVVRLLAHAPETGYTVFETPDHRYVMHLGHPEYEPARLVEEWERDSKLNRPDVVPPANVDLRAPVNLWRDHRAKMFADWLHVAAAL